jgi:TPR repeat protein
MIHLAGKGVPKNRKVAVNYLSQSANLGNTHAMYSYAKALMSSKGDETTRAKNMEKAILWLSKASYLNHSESQFELGEAVYVSHFLQA